MSGARRHGFRAPAGERGMSLVELMVAMVLGLLIVGALLTLYVNVMRSHSEMEKMNRVIENGRFAIQLLQNDLSHAGYWAGYLPQFDDRTITSPGDAPTAEPDPCLAPASWTAADLNNLIGIPVQSGLGTCAVVVDQLAGTHAIVVRYAQPVNAAPGSACPANQVCFQASRCEDEINAVPSVGYAFGTGGFTLQTMACDGTLAPVRILVSNIYYVRDDFTLMRSAYADGAFQAAVPLIEGIQALRFEYGIDNRDSSNAAVNYDPLAGTIVRGDGSPDTYVTCAPCTAAQLTDVVALKIHVLVRAPEASAGYTDTKTYRLGATGTLGPFNDGFKRHLLTTTVRLVNPSGRRETP